MLQINLLSQCATNLNSWYHHLPHSKNSGRWLTNWRIIDGSCTFHFWKVLLCHRIQHLSIKLSYINGSCHLIDNYWKSYVNILTNIGCCLNILSIMLVAAYLKSWRKLQTDGSVIKIPTFKSWAPRWLINSFESYHWKFKSTPIYFFHFCGTQVVEIRLFGYLTAYVGMFENDDPCAGKKKNRKW